MPTVKPPPAWRLSIERSGPLTTVVGSELRSLAGLGSPLVDTVALLVTLGSAAALTLTVSVIVDPAPAAGGPGGHAPGPGHGEARARGRAGPAAAAAGDEGQAGRQRIEHGEGGEARRSAEVGNGERVGAIDALGEAPGVALRQRRVDRHHR